MIPYLKLIQFFLEKGDLMIKRTGFFIIIFALMIENVGLAKLLQPHASNQLLTRKRSKDVPDKRTNSLSQKTIAKTPAQKVSEEEGDIYQWLKTYAEVVSMMQQKAFRPVDFREFTERSLKAAVEVDAHSSFFTQDSYKAAVESTSGEFSGIGVSIIAKATDDDALVIIDVVPGGPAEKAGLKGGDKIVEADGHKFKGLSTDEAVTSLKGKPGTFIFIKIIRSKKPLEFKVMRDIIKDQSSICYHFKNHHVYYLSLKIFSDNAATQMAELIKIANKGKCRGIILDLRRNPGGVLQAAIDMCGLFLDKHSLVAVTKDRNKKVVDQYFTTTDPLLKADVPIFILIDNFTASAAEILAGCLQHHAIKNSEKKDKSKHALMVFLVGIPTFGKGSVQEVIPISNGCALKLTTMLYYLPDDRSIQATGIEPDFMVKPKYFPMDEMKWITEMYGKESSLKRHITINEANGKAQDQEKKNKKSHDNESFVGDLVDLDMDKEALGKAKGDPEGDSDEKSPEKWEERQLKALGHDVQIQAAVNMINMLSMAKKYKPAILSNRQKALEFLKKHVLTDDKAEIEKVA